MKRMPQNNNIELVINRLHDINFVCFVYMFVLSLQSRIFHSSICEVFSLGICKVF